MVKKDLKTGMLATDPPPPTPDGKDSKDRDYVNIDPVRSSYYAKVVLDFIPTNNGQLLDIGCGPGFIVKEARDRGFNAYGIDVYPEAIKYGKKHLHVPIENIALEKFRPKNKFDYVTLNHVFEHISNTDTFLEKIKHLMTRDATILICSPNYQSLMRIIFGDRWYGFKGDQHVWQLTPITLANYLKSQGFTNIKSYQSHLDYNPPDKLKNLVFRIMNLGAEILGLGDQLVMTASKQAE